jgi:hypothetical protein
MKAMPIDDLGTLEYKLNQRGFKRGDALWHECWECSTRAVAMYVILGRTGGRSISLCHHCGAARSWRAAAGAEDRTLDPTFDLRKFLG